LRLGGSIAFVLHFRRIVPINPLQWQTMTTRRTYGGQSLHAAALAEPAVWQLCHFSADLPRIRLQFQRKYATNEKFANHLRFS